MPDISTRSHGVKPGISPETADVADGIGNGSLHKGLVRDPGTWRGANQEDAVDAGMRIARAEFSIPVDAGDVDRFVLALRNVQDTELGEAGWQLRARRAAVFSPGRSGAGCRKTVEGRAGCSRPVQAKADHSRDDAAKARRLPRQTDTGAAPVCQCGQNGMRRWDRLC